uniref:Malonyl-CoA decarboxylase C-terminal domain-containing protein n=1 Tax=Anguilla anguilla TaxID=7936 RepID=A0A0E9VAK6_ANGAN
MWRLNWLADSSPRGVSASCGIMVNYRLLPAGDQRQQGRLPAEQVHRRI